MCAHMGLGARYLMHQVDTWAAAQRFQDRFAGDPPTPHFGRYRYPGVDLPVQLGDVSFQQHQQQQPQPSPHPQTPPPSGPQDSHGQPEWRSPISAFVHTINNIPLPNYDDLDIVLPDMTDRTDGGDV